MKRIILASAMAISSIISFAPQSQAASVVVTTDAPPPHRYVREHREYRHHPRPHHGCTIKKVKTYRHGAVIWKETKICR